jgi:Uma2 family endonuclease
MTQAKRDNARLETQSGKEPAMSTVLRDEPVLTLADLLEQLGDISPKRIRANPPPGTATEKDLLRIHAREDRLYELVDGVLVEKVMGFLESFLACELIKLLGYFLDRHPLGFLAGPDGTVRLMPRLVRIPDISFISWDQVPNHEVPTEPIPDLAPALAIEVLSEGNTPKEMARKLKEYFLAGSHLVWFIDLQKRTVSVYTAPDRCTVLTEEQTLDGGKVLPGFVLPLKTVFAGVPRKLKDSGRKGKTRRPTKRPPRKK